MFYENKGNTQVLRYCEANELVVPLTEDLPQDIVHSLEGILYHRKVGNKMLLTNLLQKLNIDWWPWPHVDLCWLNNKFKSSNFVKMRTLPPIRCFMRELNIDRLIFILLEKSSWQGFHYGVCHFNEQLRDILTKFLRGPMISFIYSKFGTYDLYALV